MKKIINLEFLKNLFQSYCVSSLKSIIIWLFIPIIIIIVVITGTIFYFIASQQIGNNAYSNISDIVSQSKLYLDNRLIAVFEQLVYLQNDISTLSVISQTNDKESFSMRYDDYIKLDDNIGRVYSSYYSMLDSIIVSLNDGNVSLVKKDYISSDIEFSFKDWREKFNGGKLDFYWANLHENGILGKYGDENKVVSIFKIMGDMSSRSNGLILFNIKQDFFKNILENAEISAHGYLSIVSDDGMMVYKPLGGEYKINDVAMDYMRDIKRSSGIFKYKKTGEPKMVVIFDTLKVNGWKVAAILPEKEIMDGSKYIKNIILVVMGLLIIIAVVLSNVLARIITEPLSSLTAKVKKVEEGDLDTIFDINKQNEIGVLNHGIGDLIARVKNLLTQVIEEQTKKREAEFAALQAQINPHFLYNTLYSVKQLCDMQEVDDASVMVTALATFFRISVSGEREIITIDEEIQHIESYLLIQSMRYKEKLNYIIDVDPFIKKCKIVKLTLQPLIENAIYHGIKQKKGSGTVSIKGWSENGDVFFTIEDDGQGIAKDKLQKIKEKLGGQCSDGSIGIGIYNVHERLEIYYGKGYGLEVSSTEGKGTQIKLKIPIVGGELCNVV